MFPKLASAGSLYGYVDRGYWRDIGTPDSYLQAHFDILERQVDTSVGRRARRAVPVHLAVGRGRARRPHRAAVLHRRRRARRRRRAVGPLAVLGAGAVVGEGATVVEAVVQAGVVIGAHAQVEGSILVQGSSVGAGTQLNGAVLGEGCVVGAGNRLAGGICVYPDTELPDNSIQFYEQLRGREGK